MIVLVLLDVDWDGWWCFNVIVWFILVLLDV